jgi:ApaG protein
MSSEIKTESQVDVSAKTIYLEEYSKPAEKSFLFCYKISITNNGNKKVKLLNRHWIIIDSDSKKSEVRGPGVVGQQPELAPGESHEYLSFCNLETNFGTMEGSYEMIDEDNNTFFAKIPRFYLADNLNSFDKPSFKRGQIVRHKTEGFRALITDYDMYFINDEEIYNKNSNKPAKNKPWYYVLIDQSNAISYVAEEHLELEDDQESIEHPLLDFFFDGFSTKENKYLRNNKTWDELKRA